MMKAISMLLLLAVFFVTAHAAQTTLVQVSFEADKAALLTCFKSLAMTLTPKSLFPDGVTCSADLGIDVSTQTLTKFVSTPELSFEAKLVDGAISLNVDWADAKSLITDDLSVAFYMTGTTNCDVDSILALVTAEINKCEGVESTYTNGKAYDVEGTVCANCPLASNANCSQNGGCMSNNCVGGKCSAVAMFTQDPNAHSNTAATPLMVGAAFGAAAVATVVGLF